MSPLQNALTLTIDGTPDFGSEVLKSLYRLTGRSTVELRQAIGRGEPVYSASLFGADHIDVVPRLERTVDYLTRSGIPFTIHELHDGERAEISLPTMNGIIGPGADHA